jgi:hypothetical protein
VENNNFNQMLEAFDVPAVTLDQVLEAFPEIRPINLLDWVFTQPQLRKQLITRARDAITKSDFARIGNRARNEKLSPSERSILARRAALAKHRRNCRPSLEQVMMHSNGAVREPTSHKEMVAMVAESLREVGFVER